MVTTGFLVIFVVVLFGGMIVCIGLGYRFARWQQANAPEMTIGTGPVEAAVFGLMGLLLAFTFSGAAARFDIRRTLVGTEANAIGTAYLRLDLLPAEFQLPLRDEFRRYVKSRLAVYEKIPDFDAVKAELAKSEAIQAKIWGQAVAATKESQSPAVMTLVLSSLNEMFDITTTRTVALRSHVPIAIFVMLGVTVLASSLLAGYGMSIGGRPSSIHTVIFMILVSISVYVILDFEYPRLGFIRIDSMDDVLLHTIESMK